MSLDTDKAKKDREALLHARAAIEQKLARVRAYATKRLEDIQKSIEEIDVFLRVSERYLSQDIRTAVEDKKYLSTHTGLAEHKMSPENPFYGKGLPSAALFVLQTEDKEMHISEITSKLLQYGVQFAAKEPELSVDWALKQVMRQQKVIKTGPATWKVLTGENPINGADPARSAITKAGLKLAQDRGVKLGRPSKISDEMKEQILSELAKGTPLTHVATRFGLSRNGLYNRTLKWKAEG